MNTKEVKSIHIHVDELREVALKAIEAHLVARFQKFSAESGFYLTEGDNQLDLEAQARRVATILHTVTVSVKFKGQHTAAHFLTQEQ